jgi:hypothetical protein
MFDRNVIQHHFHKPCGCTPFGIGTNPKGGKMAQLTFAILGIA